MKRTNRRFAREDMLAIDELTEQLSDELGMDDVDLDVSETDDADIVPIDEDTDADADDIIAEAEKLLADTEVPDDKPVIDAEAQEVLKAADELEADINEAEEKDDVIAEAEELEAQLNATCPDCGNEKCSCPKTASEFQPGIEDKIGDEAHGGDPSVSDVVDNTVDTATDKEVFGQNTDSAYVAKITARLDRVASALERRGMKKMAFRVDQLSDRLEASVR